MFYKLFFTKTLVVCQLQLYGLYHQTWSNDKVSTLTTRCSYSPCYTITIFFSRWWIDDFMLGGTYYLLHFESSKHRIYLSGIRDCVSNCFNWRRLSTLFEYDGKHRCNFSKNHGEQLSDAFRHLVGGRSKIEQKKIKINNPTLVSQSDILTLMSRTVEGLFDAANLNCFVGYTLNTIR